MTKEEIVHDMALRTAELYVTLSRNSDFAASKDKLIKDFESTYKAAVAEYSAIPDANLPIDD